MYSMGESWTDERLDDLTAKVDRGFDRMDGRFADVERRFDGVDGRIEGLNKLIVQSVLGLAGLQVTIFVALVGFIVALH